jgi:Ca2+-binding RTX toxin-like protein
VVDSAGDTVTELAGEGIDLVTSFVSHTLAAEVENLTLIGLDPINGTGNTLNNRLIGNNAGNILDGGTGNDSMFGWEGDDTYIVDSPGDVAAEGVPAGGIDTVKSSVTFSLAAVGNIEHLTLMGAAAIDGTGNNLGNTMTGNVAANVLSGGSATTCSPAAAATTRFSAAPATTR